MSLTEITPAYLSVRQLAALLGVSLSTAYNLVYAREVPVVRVGGQYRIPLAELKDRLAASTGENDERPAATPDARPKRDITPRHDPA
jgi:excisionase family DNA binding protein